MVINAPPSHVGVENVSTADAINRPLCDVHYLQYSFNRTHLQADARCSPDSSRKRSVKERRILTKEICNIATSHIYVSSVLYNATRTKTAMDSTSPTWTVCVTKATASNQTGRL